VPLVHVAHAREKELQPTPVTYMLVTLIILLKAEETKQKKSTSTLPQRTLKQAYLTARQTLCRYNNLS